MKKLILNDLILKLRESIENLEIPENLFKSRYGCK